MAAKGATKIDVPVREDSGQLMEAFVQFVRYSTTKTLSDAEAKVMNTKAAGKMGKDNLSKDMANRLDSSVFPAFQDKATKTIKLTPKICEEFCYKCAHEEIKIKRSAAQEGDDDVKAKYEAIRTKLMKSTVKKDSTKISSKGNVAGLTDTSKYTGSHKERFDDSGKGKGKEGRENVHENTGYVGQYKGKDSYDKTH